MVDKSLLENDYRQADAIIQKAEDEYGTKSRVLYGMDRGMTLQLAGEYERSNEVLEQAEDELDRLYTRSVRTESLAFVTNDNSLPYEGEPYEQVMINVLKALNYASLNRWQDALVEARRIDHRLNVLADRTKDKAAYHDDGFARYLSGILYESAGDLNNAFIAYRKAYETFDASACLVTNRRPGAAACRLTTHVRRPAPEPRIHRVSASVPGHNLEER